MKPNKFTIIYIYIYIYPHYRQLSNSVNNAGKHGTGRVINAEESSVYYPWVARISRKYTLDVKTTTDYKRSSILCMGSIISYKK